jgi:hypothetical protein
MIGKLHAKIARLIGLTTATSDLNPVGTNRLGLGSKIGLCISPLLHDRHHIIGVVGKCHWCE